MGKQEFSTDLQEMLMGLMGCDMRAMVQRLYEMLMSMEVDSKLKEWPRDERTEERAGYRSQAQQPDWGKPVGSLGLSRKAVGTRSAAYRNLQADSASW